MDYRADFRLNQQFNFDADALAVYDFLMGPKDLRPREWETTDGAFAFACRFLTSSDSSALYSIVLGSWMCSGQEIDYQKDSVNWLIWDKEIAKILLIQREKGTTVVELHLENNPWKWHTDKDSSELPKRVGSRFVVRLWRELIQSWVTEGNHMQNPTEAALNQILSTMQDLAVRTDSDFIDDKDIAARTSFEIQYVRDLMDILEEKRLIHSANSADSYCAELTAKGRLKLKDPAFQTQNTNQTIIIRDNNGVFLNINSSLDNVTQAVNLSNKIQENDKADLTQLLEQLRGALTSVPAEYSEDAEAVTELAKQLVEGVTKEKPNKSMLSISADGLKKAANNLAQIAPSVAGIVGQIISKLPI